MPNRRPPEAQTFASPDWPERTHWSIVLAAGDPAAPRAAVSLDAVCRAVWYPGYAYVRRCGQSALEAEDLTQSFFLHLLTSKALAAATPKRGRFRVFLRTCVDHFIVTCWRRGHAIKRGGQVSFLSWEQDGSEHRYQADALSPLTPEALFDRTWADTLLNRVLSQLEASLVSEGKNSLFERLKDRLIGDPDAASYAELADTLGTTEAALKMTVRRLRLRYRELLLREIAHTVSSRDEAEQELQHLLTVVSA